MAFISRFFNALQGKPPSGSDRYLTLYVWSNRCREPIAGQVDLMNETSLSDAGDGSYYVRKVVHNSGKNRCFDSVEVELWLDSKKRLVNQTVTGGRWLTAQEYEAEVARLAAEASAEAQATAAPPAEAAGAEAGTEAGSDEDVENDQPTS